MTPNPPPSDVTEDSLEMMTLTDLFWARYVKCDFGHHRRIPEEIGSHIVRYCDMSVFRVHYRIRTGTGNQESSSSNAVKVQECDDEQMKEHQDWKSSLFCFKSRVKFSSFIDYLEDVDSSYYSDSLDLHSMQYVQSEEQQRSSLRDAIVWFSGPNIDFLVIHSKWMRSIT